MDLEEELQQGAETRFGRIEDDLDPFRMGPVVALGRIGNIAAGATLRRQQWLQNNTFP